jgi:hypothetical protein
MRGTCSTLNGLEAPHEVFAVSLAGRQVVVFAATTDTDGFFAIIRDTFHGKGVASISALVWDEDPRRSPTGPARVLLAGLEPRQRGLGRDYDDILERLLSTSDVVSGSPN